MKPLVACLMPTYGRPKLVANSIACFNAQTYPADRRILFILDDLGQFKGLESERAPSYEDHSRMCFSYPSVHVTVAFDRYPSLPSKYTYLMGLVKDLGIDYVMVWDDDDVYLPDYIESHSNSLQTNMWSHPELIWSDYGNVLRLEPASGRFHGSLAAHRLAIEMVGGWEGVLPSDHLKRADFDQKMIAALKQRFGLPGRPEPVHDPNYIFRWGSTGHPHCQSLMKSPENETWYDQVKAFDPKIVSTLEPKFDGPTEYYYTRKTMIVA